MGIFFSRSVTFWSDPDDIRAAHDELAARLEQLGDDLPLDQRLAVKERLREYRHWLRTREKLKPDERGVLHWVEPQSE